MYVIEVEIKNKKAVRTNETAYVCDNSDFTVVFSFDEEWNEFDAKTARFSYDDKYQDVVFTGNECPMPIISNTKLIFVGVFAGDLHTTTPARIVANKSILSAAGTPEPPSDDVYNQMMLVLNGKADKKDTYTKAEVDEKISNSGGGGSADLSLEKTVSGNAVTSVTISDFAIAPIKIKTVVPNANVTVIASGESGLLGINTVITNSNGEYELIPTGEETTIEFGGAFCDYTVTYQVDINKVIEQVDKNTEDIVDIKASVGDFETALDNAIALCDAYINGGAAE